MFSEGRAPGKEAAEMLERGKMDRDLIEIHDQVVYKNSITVKKLTTAFYLPFLFYIARQRTHYAADKQRLKQCLENMALHSPRHLLG